MQGTHRADPAGRRDRGRYLKAAGLGALVGVTVLALLPGSPLVAFLDGSGDAGDTVRPPVAQTPGVETSAADEPPAPTQPPLPSTAGLTAALEDPLRAPALGPDGSVGVVVRDLATGVVLLDVGGDTPRTAASTAKLVTAVSALHHLGPGATLTTRTVRGATPDELVLVGGGDLTLTVRGGGDYPGSASLRRLARETATALRAEGTTQVRLLLDDSAFTGPAVAPDWEAGDLANGTVGPVTALSIDAGRTEPGGRLRHADPAAAAGAEFARLLRAADITVTSVARGRAPTEPTEPLAAVSSPTVAALVERMLLRSDNDIAEALARAAGRAAGAGSDFAGGVRAAQQALTALGLDPSGLTLLDGSGLSRGNAVTPVLLSDVVVAAADSERPELAAVLSGLPVAGVTGTLAARFGDGAARGARGVVRAKTGTLTGVHGLAGTVVDTEGGVLAVTVLADDTVAGFTAAREAIDGLLVAVAACGCRPAPAAGAPVGP